MIVSAAFDGGLAACRLAQREIMMAIASKRHSVRRNISDLAKSHSPCVFAQPVRTYQAAVRFRRIEEIKNLGFVKARQLAKRPDGGTHLRTLDCTQKSQ